MQASHRLVCITLALFCLHFHIPFPNVSLPVLLSFLQFLTLNSLSVPTIKNYLSSIKSKFRQLGLPLSVFSSPQLSLFITSLEKNSPTVLPLKPIFTPSQLLALLLRTSSLPLHALYHAAFSLAFLAMLHISNIAPPTSSSFDPLSHLRRGDIRLFF
jgi:hypothetical protein